jgi:hypothetical protein
MEIINFLKSFAQNNGATQVIVLILTVILTNLIKIPIKKHAEKIAALAQKSGFKVSQSFITSMIVYIPFGVTLVLFCIADAISVAAGGVFDFVDIMAKTPIIAAASIGLYSIVSNTIEKASQKSEYKEYISNKIATTDAAEIETPYEPPKSEPEKATPPENGVNANL